MAKKRKRLDLVVTAIQRRFGPKALQRGEQALHPAVALPHISTSFPNLDETLDGIGGIPYGRITEILAAPTSGMTTLALKILAQAQEAGDLAIYVDLGQNFDPDYAARCGVNKEKWIYRQNDVRGYQARVLVLKNQLGKAGQSAKIAITFNGMVRGDST